MKAKKILSLLVAMAMIFCMGGLSAYAEETTSIIKVANLAELQAALIANNDLSIVITDTIVIPAGEIVVLDLNGKTVTVPEAEDRHLYAIDNQGDLTLTDNAGGGSITSRGIYNGYNGNAENAKLTVESGKYVGMDNGGATIFNAAELIIDGGEFYGYKHAVNNVADTADTTINGGVFGGACILDSGTAVSTNYLIYNNAGIITINDADVVSGWGAVYCYGGTTEINDGNFHPVGWKGYTSHIIYVDADADVTIDGGIFKMNYPDDEAPDSGEAVASYYGGTVNIAGGEFYAHFDNVSPVQLSSGSVITGGSFMNHSGEASNHSYITTFVKEGYKLGEDGNVVETAPAKTYVAQVGDVEYTDLQVAINEADGQTVTLLTNIEQADGVTITNKNLTIDLAENTFTVTEGSSTNSRNFLINGNSVVTIKNGTLVAGGDTNSGTYGTIRTEGTAVVTLDNLELYNYRGNGLNIKSLGGTNVKISNTNVYSQYGGGIEAAGATITLDNVNVYQKGLWTAPYNSMAISVNGGGTVIVNSGYYATEPLSAEDAYSQGSSHGSWAAGVLNSGGTLVINDGTFVNGNFGDDSLATTPRGLILADTGANIQIKGGTFNALKSIIDIQNNLGDASKNPSGTITGGTFSADPTNGYVTIADDLKVVKNADGTYGVERAGTLATENVLIQNMAQGTTTDGVPTYRVGCFAAIDSANYSMLGIEVKADGGKITGSGTTQYLYTYINVTNSEGVATKILPETLGETNKYIFGRIMAFTTNYTDFSFRPFAVSLDGKKTFYGNWSKEYIVDPE